MCLLPGLLQTALSVLEVALELWLALTASPQARMIKHGTSMASAMLQVGCQQLADSRCGTCSVAGRSGHAARLVPLIDLHNPQLHVFG